MSPSFYYQFHWLVWLALPFLSHAGNGVGAAKVPPAQQYHAITNFVAADGDTIAGCIQGYRAAGRLNAAKSNAVLVPTWFTGTSAQLMDPQAAMNAFKLVDTSRYFLICADALGNGVSSSPSNTKGFPPVAIADMVKAQQQLIAHLGIKKLYAVVGISMGGMQAFDWWVRFPGQVGKVVSVVGSPKTGFNDQVYWQTGIHILSQRNGDSTARLEMWQALAGHTQLALYTPGYWNSHPDPAGFNRFIHQQAVAAMQGQSRENWIVQASAMIHHDIYPLLLQRNRNQLPSACIVVANKDAMVTPHPAKELAKDFGLPLYILEGNCGHMATFCEAHRLAGIVRGFLK